MIGKGLVDRLPRKPTRCWAVSIAVLIFDESGFAKKGEASAGVARQWNGRLGKVDNCQVGVFATLCRGDMATLIDARLYLPEDWCNDDERCKKAAIPEGKPAVSK